MNSETRDNEPSGALHGSTSSARRPWRVEAATATKGVTVWSDAGMQIAETGHAEFDLSHAHLIAAAPELLAHLKHMIWLVETELQHDGGHIVENAKAVVENLT